MSIQEVISMVASAAVSSKQLDELNKILDEADKSFERQAQSSSVTNEFLSRTYSL